MRKIKEKRMQSYVLRARKNGPRRKKQRRGRNA